MTGLQQGRPSFQAPLAQTSPFLHLGLSLKNRPDGSSSRPGVTRIELTVGGETVAPVITFNVWF